jgi:FkbM family methyltransferase
MKATMLLPSRNQRCGRHFLPSVLRIALSLLRVRSSRHATPVVGLGASNARIIADLRTPLGLSLYRYGFCDPLAALIWATLRPGDSFLDGGANVGLFTLVAASAVGERGKVVACEPAPETMKLLRRNLALNNFDWVDLHQVALAERSGEMSFLSFEAGSAFSSFAPADEANATKHHVRAMTLDELTHDLRELKLVKLDIEGAEVRALRGARDLLKAHRPVFIIEVEPGHLERQGTSIEQLARLLEEARYETFHFAGRGDDIALTAPSVGNWLPPVDNPNIVACPRERPLALTSSPERLS